MKRRSTLFAFLATFGAAIAPAGQVAAQTVSDLAGKTHIHGLAFDRTDPARIYIATHHGLMRSAGDGSVERVSATADDFMGFVPHPSDPAVFYASGHPQGGGNLGLIRSDDGGKTWEQLSPGVDGPVDFHQLAVSPGDPAVLYGAFGGIQASRDGGKSWERVGDAPAALIDLAVSPADPDTVYAATENGLMISRDGAASWRMARAGAPVTAVETMPDGRVLAFAYGEGLLRAEPDSTEFAVVESAVPGGTYLLHLAADPDDDRRLLAAAGGKVVLVSTDGGATWSQPGK